MDNVDTYKVNKEAVKKIAEKVYDNGSTVINRNDLEELFPELQESGDKRMIKFIKQQLFNIKKTITENYELDAKLTKAIDWLEKQGDLMKALQISNANIGELVEKNYHLKEQLEKQGEHANFLSKIQVGDKVTRNEDGVLVNISQLNRVAKKRKNQGNNMGISEATKQKLEDNLNKALEKETPESCNEFLEKQGNKKETLKERNICDTCEDSNGCLIPCCAKLLEKQGEQKTADKVEPKFHEGEWVIDKQDIVHQISNVIENVTNHTYGYDIVGEGYFNDNTEGVRLWTIQDAKDGDVLYENDTETIFIFESQTCGWIKVYCDYWVSKDKFTGTDKADYGRLSEMKLTPATKEQRDLLFQKIKEAGYEWDSEKKELKKVEQKKDTYDKLTTFEFSLKHIIEEAIECGDIHNLKADADLLLRIAQKTSWSEEDENYYDAIIAKLEVIQDDALLTDNQMDFLKSIKGRVQPKQEWSEEDNRICKAIIDNIQAICEEGYFVGNIDSDELIKWLKSLEERVQSQQQEWSEENERIYKSIAYSFAHNYPLTVQQQEFVKSLKERYTWKPSDEQMDAIDYVKNFDYGGYKDMLVSLYYDLKKLK